MEIPRFIKQKATDVAHDFLYGSNTPSERFLPASILYAAKHKGTVHEAKEIEDLLRNNFAPEAFYLFLRALNEHPTEQKNLLQESVEAFTDSDSTAQDVLLTRLKEYPEIATPSVKLAQINRQGGIDFWHDSYRKKAQIIKAYPSNPSPVLLAYASLIGLSDFIQEFKDISTPLFIANQKWISDDNNPYAGYRIGLNRKPDVSFLEKGSDRPDNIVTIVDTRKTGSLEKCIWEFWTGKNNIEIDDEKMFANVKVPQKNSTNIEEE